MVAYTRKQVGYLLRIDFVRFCIVGGTGFVINLIILTTLHNLLGLAVFVAQLIAAEIALFSNFMLHHHWTYKSHKIEKSIPTLLVQFHASSWPAILGSALMVTAAQEILHFNTFFALAVSSLIALLWNFGWSKYVVWKDMTKAEIERIAK